jgi:hypothetical protein
MFSMKKSLSLLRLLTAAILLSASGGCSETNDPDPEGGGDPPVKEPVTYTIALGETSEQGAAVKVTPSDETATYYNRQNQMRRNSEPDATFRGLS